MRHKVAGYKLGRNTSHRRSLLRNLVTSVIVEERIETTVPKAKAARPIVEKMITLGKRGDLAARRLAASYLMTDEAVVKLFDTVGPAFRRPQWRLHAHHSHRTGKGRRRRQGVPRTAGQRKGAGREEREKRAEARAKKAAEAKKAMEEAEAQAQHDGGVEPVKEEEKTRKSSSRVTSFTEGTAFAPCLFLFAGSIVGRQCCATVHVLRLSRW